MNKEETSRYVGSDWRNEGQIDEDSCDFLVEQRLAEQVEPDYLEDGRFRVVAMERFLDLERTEFPYRSFYVPLEAFEKHVKYNPYYLARRVGEKKKKEEEEGVEICLEEDTCVLESSDEYLEGEEKEEAEL